MFDLRWLLGRLGRRLGRGFLGLGLLGRGRLLKLGRGLFLTAQGFLGQGLFLALY